MGSISHQHPPVRRRTLLIVLNLAKRPEGVSWKEAVVSGGSNNLPCRIKELEGQGHCFNRDWEKGPHGSRYYRYWWTGWEEPPPPPSTLPPALPANQRGTYDANL